MKKITVEIEDIRIKKRIKSLKKVSGIEIKRINTLCLYHGIKAAEKDPTILTTINSENLKEKA